MSCSILHVPILLLPWLPVAEYPEPQGSEPRPRQVSLKDRYQPAADRIMASVASGHGGWRKMEELCDGIGHRLSGSPELEQAVAWAVESLKRDGHENVRAEPVKVPCWVRGAESVTMVEPRVEPLVMLGLGGSVGTPPEGITAPVEVVEDESSLDALGDGARGKMILFNNPMSAYDPDQGSGYGTAVRFRHKGAVLAAKRGAVATLVRSVTTHSLRTPHTGAMSYEGSDVRVPAAALSVEDAELIARLRRRGERVVLNLRMGAETRPDAESANVVGELRGSTWPDEIVILSGHLDAWDVGQGAHDDAGGCVISMEALSVLRRLGLIPRRTIRVVLWTNEENGLRGAKEYAARHAGQLPDHVAAIESDGGLFRPRGFSLECSDEGRERIALEQMRGLVRLLEPLGATRVELGGSGADVGVLKPAGVVLLGHDVDGSTYFDYHHTPADTLDKVDPEMVSRNVALMAITAYVLADMPERLGSQGAP